MPADPTFEQVIAALKGQTRQFNAVADQLERRAPSLPSASDVRRPKRRTEAIRMVTDQTQELRRFATQLERTDGARNGEPPK